MGVTVRERQKNSGIYWVFINQRGRRKAVQVGQDRKLAQKLAKKFEEEIALNETILRNNRRVPTFAELAKTWIRVVVPAICKPSTASDYRGILENHVLPTFGRMCVADITRLKVKEFLLQKVNKGFAASTIIHMKNVISGIFNAALDDGIIAINPAQRLGRLFRNTGFRIACEPLTKAELSQLLKKFKEHYPAHYPLALTLARTGMRLGEAFALQWGDIDFNKRFISVQRGFARGKIEVPKNGKARRIDMSQQLADVLQELQYKRKLEVMKNCWGQMPGWVFVTGKGTALNTANWRNRIFNKVLEKAGLRKIHPHVLRHTYASLLIQAGVSLAYIRDQLGHHSIKVTVDIYGHLAPEGNKEAVDGLDDATGRNQKRMRA
jgi:integrase